VELRAQPISTGVGVVERGPDRRLILGPADSRAAGMEVAADVAHDLGVIADQRGDIEEAVVLGGPVAADPPERRLLARARQVTIDKQFAELVVAEDEDGPNLRVFLGLVERRAEPVKLLG